MLFQRKGYYFERNCVFSLGNTEISLYSSALIQELIINIGMRLFSLVAVAKKKNTSGKRLVKAVGLLIDFFGHFRAAEQTHH